jgi:hypothetical protein
MEQLYEEVASRLLRPPPQRAERLILRVTRLFGAMRSSGPAGIPARGQSLHRSMATTSVSSSRSSGRRRTGTTRTLPRPSWRARCRRSTSISRCRRALHSNQRRPAQRVSATQRACGNSFLRPDSDTALRPAVLPGLARGSRGRAARLGESDSRRGQLHQGHLRDRCAGLGAARDGVCTTGANAGSSSGSGRCR